MTFAGWAPNRRAPKPRAPAGIPGRASGVQPPPAPRSQLAGWRCGVLVSLSAAPRWTDRHRGSAGAGMDRYISPLPKSNTVSDLVPSLGPIYDHRLLFSLSSNPYCRSLFLAPGVDLSGFHYNTYYVFYCHICPLGSHHAVILVPQSQEARYRRSTYNSCSAVPLGPFFSIPDSLQYPYFAPSPPRVSVNTLDQRTSRQSPCATSRSSPSPSRPPPLRPAAEYVGPSSFASATSRGTPLTDPSRRSSEMPSPWTITPPASPTSPSSPTPPSAPSTSRATSRAP